MATRRYPNLPASVRRSLRALNLEEADKAAADLAVTYAVALQDAADAAQAAATDLAAARARLDADPDDEAVIMGAADAAEAAASAAAAHAKIVGWHGPHLLNTLAALSATPVARAGVAKKEMAKVSKLADMRARRRAAAAGE